MHSATRVAASTLLQGLLGGTVQSGRVLGAFSCAVYLEIAGEFVAIETSDALGLPCAAVVPVHSLVRPFRDIHPGDPVRAGEGQLHVGSWCMQVVRWWQPRRAPLQTSYDVTRLAAVRQLLPLLAPSLAQPLARLSAALQADRMDLRAEVLALLGFGPGLTPAGDDVLAGMLLSTRSLASSRRFTGCVSAAAPGRTTAVGAALLRHAAAGYAISPVLDLLHAFTGSRSGASDSASAPQAVVRLLAVGHTSGPALAHGVLTGSLLTVETASREVA